MLSRKASVLVRPAVAGMESNCARSSSTASSRTRFFAEDSRSYGLGGITLGDFGKFLAGGIDFRGPDQVFHILKIDASLKTVRAAEGVQFHRDKMERARNGEGETVPDVAAAARVLDFGKGLGVGKHQIHGKGCGRVGLETQADKIGRPVKNRVPMLLEKGEPAFRIGLSNQEIDIESGAEISVQVNGVTAHEDRFEFFGLGLGGESDTVGVGHATTDDVLVCASAQYFAAGLGFRLNFCLRSLGGWRIFHVRCPAVAGRPEITYGDTDRISA